MLFPTANSQQAAAKYADITAVVKSADMAQSRQTAWL